MGATATALLSSFLLQITEPILNKIGEGLLGFFSPDTKEKIESDPSLTIYIEDIKKNLMNMELNSKILLIQTLKPSMLLENCKKN